jgi:hypothetical protein
MKIFHLVSLESKISTLRDGDNTKASINSLPIPHYTQNIFGLYAAPAVVVAFLPVDDVSAEFVPVYVAFSAVVPVCVAFSDVDGGTADFVSVFVNFSAVVKGTEEYVSVCVAFASPGLE